MAQDVKIELLSPDIAADDDVIRELANLVNWVYAEAEDGLWADGATRYQAA